MRCDIVERFQCFRRQDVERGPCAARCHGPCAFKRGRGWGLADELIREVLDFGKALGHAIRQIGVLPPDLLGFVHDGIKANVLVSASARPPEDLVSAAIRKCVRPFPESVTFIVSLPGHETEADVRIDRAHGVPDGFQQLGDRAAVVSEPCAPYNGIPAFELAHQAFAGVSRAVFPVEPVETALAETPVPDGHVTVPDIVVDPDHVRPGFR